MDSVWRYHYRKQQYGNEDGNLFSALLPKDISYQHNDQNNIFC